MKKKILLVFLLSTLLIATFYFKDFIDISAFNTWVKAQGMLAPFFFMAIYIVLTVAAFPSSILTLAGGAIFGVVWGTMYNLIAATIGASCAFLIARFLGANWVQNQSQGRLKKIIDGVNEEGWQFVAFTRLVPLFPFNVLNYALGLSAIRFIPYVATSFICMAPGALAYTYLGSLGGSALAGEQGLIKQSLLGLALFAIVLFIPKLILKYRKRR